MRTRYSAPKPFSVTVCRKQSTMELYAFGDTAIRVRTVSSGKHT